MGRMSAWGVSVELPRGWDSRIYRRPSDGPAPGRLGGAAGSAAGTAATAAATTHAVLHAATFALPPDAGDFGSGAVETMGPDDVLVVLFEYHPSSAGAALFRRQGVPPPLRAERFRTTGLQRAVAGQSGSQEFFSAAGRAWCLYVVLGSHAGRHRLVPVANSVLATLTIDELRP